MKIYIIALFLFMTPHCFGQLVIISGKATDSTNGTNVVEIVVNDTLSKIAQDSKEGRARYFKLYQDPGIVVRTDSTGIFQIRASVTDSLYFKSYQHITQAYLVRDLIKRKAIDIHLRPKPIAKAD